MLLTVGSSVLAVINVGVMWAMAHRWRFAWHGNLALQLAWLPYDFLTRQYGLLALGITMTFVSLKACFYKERPKGASLEARGQSPRRRRSAPPRHAQRRPRGRDMRRPESLPPRALGSVADRRTGGPAGPAAGEEAAAQEDALQGAITVDTTTAEPGCLAGGVQSW
jgi:hypothetical protein